MKMIRVVLPFVLACFLAACSGRRGQAAGDASVDFSALSRRSLADFPDERIAGRTFVSMDTSRAEFLFNRADQVKLRGGNIYLLYWNRHDDTRILVFDSAGKGVVVLDRRGQGPQEYAQISAFDVDDGGNIHIVDGNRDQLLVYGADGRFISRRALPFEAEDVRCLSGGDYLFALCNWNRGEAAGRKVALTAADLSVKKTYFRYGDNADMNAVLDRNGFSDAPRGMTAFNESLSDRIYLFDAQGGLADSLCVDFGSRAIPETEKSDVERNIWGNTSYCCLSGPSSVLGEFVVGRMYGGRSFSYILDRAQGTMYSDYEQGRPDAFSHIIGFSGRKIVSWISPEMLQAGPASHIPEQVKQFVADENYVLCLTELY